MVRGESASHDRVVHSELLGQPGDTAHRADRRSLRSFLPFRTTPSSRPTPSILSSRTTPSTPARYDGPGPSPTKERLMPDVIHDKCDRLFALYDADGNGHLDHEDVKLMVNRILIGSNVPADSPKAAALEADYDAWWRALLAHADVNGDGVITRDEFRTTMSGLSAADPALHNTVRQAVDAVFSALDSDDDNKIPATALVAMFSRGGLSQDDATEAARVFDLDSDGTITREEYATRWLDFFTTDDPEAPASRILGKLS